LSATHLRHLLLSATKLAASAPLLAWAALTPSALLSLRLLLLLSATKLAALYASTQLTRSSS
jgi:ABC-type transporter Mla subunit MlaD